MSKENETLEELVVKHNEANEALRKQIDEKIEAKASKEDISALKSELLDNNNKQLEQINEALKSQGIAIKNMADAKNKPENGEKSLNELVSEKAEDIALLGKSREGRVKMSVKAAATMVTGNITGGDYVQAQRLPGFNELPITPINNILGYVSRRNASSPLIEWVDKRNRDGAADYTGEGLLKNQIDFDFVIESTKVQKITAFTKVSREMLNDVSYVRSAIDQNLREVVFDKLAAEVLGGAGGANAIEGIITKAEPWAAGDFANKIDAPNIYDVLRTALTQITLEGYSANVMILNPVDYSLMMMTKSTEATYVDGQFLFMGVPVIQNAALPAGKFLVYNTASVEMYMWENFSIEIGYENDDLTKNLITMVGELRACNVISTNKAKGIVYGDIATAQTALTKA